MPGRAHLTTGVSVARIVGCVALCGGAAVAGCGGDVSFQGDASSGASGGQGTGGLGGKSGGAANGGGGSGGRAPSDGGFSLGGEAAAGGSTATGGFGQAGGGASTGGTASNPCWALGEFFDDFDDPAFTRDCWKTYNSELLVAGTESGGYSLDPLGALVLRPKNGVAWKQDTSGFLFYQEVTGDFRLEVQAWVWAAGISEDAPESTETFGGLLLQAGRLSEQGSRATDYYAIKVGRFFDTAGVRTQVKSGADVPLAKDQRDDLAWDNTYLRICRVGAQVWTAYLPSGQSDWIPLHFGDELLGYDSRDELYPDLTDTVSVGILGEIGDAGAASGSSQIVVGSATFVTPESIDGCAYQF